MSEQIWTDYKIRRAIDNAEHVGGGYNPIMKSSEVRKLLTQMRDQYEWHRRTSAAPPVNDIRDVLDYLHMEVAGNSQAGVIEPSDRDKLLALAGRVEAWLVKQGEAV